MYTECDYCMSEDVLRHFCVLFQLARIQTDSVAEKLKELFPDLKLEIGIKFCFFYL